MAKIITNETLDKLTVIGRYERTVEDGTETDTLFSVNIRGEATLAKGLAWKAYRVGKITTYSNKQGVGLVELCDGKWKTVPREYRPSQYTLNKIINMANAG